MEVHSAQKSSSRNLTLAAAVALLTIAILQSVSMHIQKQRYWQGHLGDTVEVDDQLSIKIPHRWTPAPDNEDGLIHFEPADTLKSKMQLWIIRPPTGHISSLTEAWQFVISEVLGTNTSSKQIEASDPTACALGPLPAEWTAITMYEPGDNQQIRIYLLAAVDEQFGTTIIGMVPTNPEEDSVARYLLRTMADNAKFEM